jgi:hypothetical protein
VTKPSGWAQAVTIGIMFPALLAAGYLLGKWIGRWLGLGEWTALLGAGIGVGGAFVELFRWSARQEGE